MIKLKNYFFLIIMLVYRAIMRKICKSKLTYIKYLTLSKIHDKLDIDN